MAQSSPLEIVKRLPRTNCKKCGYPSCLAFAMALMTGAARPEACPEADPSLLKEFEGGPVAPEADYAWRILEEVKARARRLDWGELPARTGGSPEEGGILLPFLDGEVLITPKEARRLDGLELDPRDQILLYNYLLMAAPGEPSGRYVGLESFPNSISKVQTLRRYAEEKCAQHFSGRLDALKEALGRFEARFPTPCPADLCAEVRVLPKVWLRLHFFEAEPEEGLSAEVKIMFDERAVDFLDLESLVFSAERLVERLIELAPREG